MNKEKNKSVKGRFSITENVTITVIGKDGVIKDERFISNLITNAGFAGMASRCNGDGAEAVFTYIAVGTGNTAAAVGDTTLETELAADGLSRAAGTEYDL